jgi:hypothetical protein
MAFVATGLAAVTLGVLPAVASAQTPVATAVLYEVAEALKFKGAKAATDPTSFTRRIAEATLLGKEIQGAPGTPFFGAQFMTADARSAVDLQTGVGPISGSFDLLADTDPARNSLDTLVITASATLQGTLDLTTATQGYAAVEGDYKIKGRKPKVGGPFQGVFLIPFQVPIPGLETQYWYLDLGPTQGTCTGRTDLPIGPNYAPVSVCPLADFEFSLGIPLTKAVIVLFD